MDLKKCALPSFFGILSYFGFVIALVIIFATLVFNRQPGGPWKLFAIAAAASIALAAIALFFGYLNSLILWRYAKARLNRAESASCGILYALFFYLSMLAVKHYFWGNLDSPFPEVGLWTDIAIGALNFASFAGGISLFGKSSASKKPNQKQKR